MKENLESKHIGNRKIIIEIRYNPVVTMLDQRGQMQLSNGSFPPSEPRFDS